MPRLVDKTNVGFDRASGKFYAAYTLWAELGHLIDAHLCTVFIRQG